MVIGTLVRVCVFVTFNSQLTIDRSFVRIVVFSSVFFYFDYGVH